MTGREESFAMMLEKSVKCVVWLRNENVEAGDVVGVCTHNQMDTYVPLLAALYTLAPLSTHGVMRNLDMVRKISEIITELI